MKIVLRQTYFTKYGRVDILYGNISNFLDVSAQTVVQNIDLGVDPQSKNPNLYTFYPTTMDCNHKYDCPFYLRFAIVVNRSPLNMDVDNVIITAVSNSSLTDDLGPPDTPHCVGLDGSKFMVSIKEGNGKYFNIMDDCIFVMNCRRTHLNDSLMRINMDWIHMWMKHTFEFVI